MAVDPRRMRPRKVPGAPPASTLPPPLAVLFNPGPPLPFKPAITRRKVMPLTGVSQFLGEFETTPPPERVVHKTRLDRKKKKLERRAANHKAKLAEAVANYKPKEQIEGGNAYNTLFVSNMSYETDEDSLRREFDVYGPIVSLKIVRDQNGKSRGYAFVEYEAEADMKTAYKRADGRKVDGRRVNVDVERGRTVRGWLPRRLGGGLGRGRPAKPSKEEIIIAQRTNKFVPSGYSAPRAYIGGGGPRLRVGGGSGGGGGYSRGGDDRGRDRSRGGDDRGRGSSRDHRGPSRSHRGDSSRDARPSRSRGRSRRPSSRSRSPVRRSRR